jgi:CRP-like cAMP-binding protein
MHAGVGVTPEQMSWVENGPSRARGVRVAVQQNCDPSRGAIFTLLHKAEAIEAQDGIRGLIVETGRGCSIDASRTPKANALLAALPEAAYRRLLPDLQAATLQDGEALLTPSGGMEYAYFPTRSIVALLHDVDAAGAMVKAWPVGREGMLGISIFLGVPKFISRADVQIGGSAVRLPAAALLAEFRQAGALQQLLLRYVFAVITQASQLGVCNNYHSVEQRLCRFLLRAFDRVGGDQIGLTQGRIAELLGVRRVSITKAAIDLQSDDLIEYVRGRVRLVNRKKLEQRSCVCAAVIKRAFEAVVE